MELNSIRRNPLISKSTEIFNFTEFHPDKAQVRTLRYKIALQYEASHPKANGFFTVKTWKYSLLCTRKMSLEVIAQDSKRNYDPHVTLKL